MDREADLAALVALLRADGQLAAESNQQSAVADIRRWRDAGIAALAAGNPRYPVNLAGVPYAPPLLFVRGVLTEQDCAGIAIVGTRRPGASGLRDASDSARLLAQAGLTVVSGLARGIDTAAHVAALDAGGRTVAVLGTGLDHAYPPENATLQARIAATGALVSQFWPELGPTRDGFVSRNALMAGLTRATVIVEAHATSGTRIQARHALAYGRRVILFERVLGQPWARLLAQQPGVEVVEDPEQLVAALKSDQRSLTADQPMKREPVDER